MNPWDLVKRGYLRLIGPMVDWLVARGVSPNAITTLGTVCATVAGGIYAAGHIRIAGWVFGLTAVFDVVDGQVARKSGRSSVFGAFYDSTLDRVADGAVLGGLALFFARNGVHHSIPYYMSTPMVSVILFGIIGSFLTSYTRARAEGLGIDAKVGILQRPERIVLLSAPQAFFGLAFGGWVLIAICVLLSVTAWVTVVQRIAFVHRATTRAAQLERRGPPPEREEGVAMSKRARGEGAGDGTLQSAHRSLEREAEVPVPAGVADLPTAGHPAATERRAADANAPRLDVAR